MDTHFLQSEAWARFHEASGHQTFSASGDGWHYLAILEAGGGGLKRLYTPYGPTVTSLAALKEALSSLTQLAKRVGAAYLRVQPSGPQEGLPTDAQPELTPAALESLGLQPIQHSQPQHTWRVDLRQDRDAIIGAFHQSKRSLYRNYTKKGLAYRVSQDPADVEHLIRLMAGVAASNQITTHTPEYFRTQAQALLPTGRGRLHLLELAGQEGEKPEVIAAALSYDDDAITYYAYAAADFEHRKLQASTVLLAELIVGAHEKGKKALDMYGITTSEDPEHPWAGFTKFKKTFGGYQHDFTGTYELPVKPLAYNLYRGARALSQKRSERASTQAEKPGQAAHSDIARFATEQEIADWDQLLQLAPNVPDVLQMRAFAQTKATRGWIPRYIVTPSGGHHVALERRIPGLGQLWYFPKGPNVDSVDALLEQMSQITPLARENGVFLIKVEPDIIEVEGDHAATAVSTGARDRLEASGFKRAVTLQANESTVLLDISGTYDDFLSRLRTKTRNRIKRAAKEEPRFEAPEVNAQSAKKFYQVFEETSAGRFDIRSLDYYQNFWENYARDGHGQIFFAYDGDRIVSAAFTQMLGDLAVYKDGASVAQKSIPGASHYLQARIIEWMIERGYTRYDMCGTPPLEQIDDRTHRFHGMGEFKTSFSKTVTTYVGTYDLVIRPLQAKIWDSVGEQVALAAHHRKYGDSMY